MDITKKKTFAVKFVINIVYTKYYGRNATLKFECITRREIRSVLCKYC